MTQYVRLKVCLAVVFVATSQIVARAESPAASTESKTRLEIAGTQFTINGRPVFLYGISYYAALGAPQEFVVRDLDDMQRLGFNWIRVWATWSAFDNDVSAVDNEGRPRKSYLGKLKWLAAECDRRGMIVDVTLTKGEGRLGNAHVSTLDKHGRALQTLASELKPWRNWYLDMANEHNIRSKTLVTKYVSTDDARTLRNCVREADAQRLVTISYVHDIAKEDVRHYLFDVDVDFLSPHRPRNSASTRQTEQITRQYLAWMRELGRVVPVHYQEPFRRDFSKGWQPKAEDFATDLRGAIQGGAAGWCFHNGDNRWAADARPRRSFDMREKRLFEQLDDVEQQTLKRLAGLARSSIAESQTPTLQSSRQIGRLSEQSVPAPAAGPLRVHRANPRYFADGSGKVVYLTGSHTWDIFQRWLEGNRGMGRPADFSSYLDVLRQHHHNFIRFWVADTGWSPVTRSAIEPQPYVRTGPGKAADGGLKFDLNRLNQAYFDELRTRVVAARDCGMYVGVMLFNGWGVGVYRESPHDVTWDYHPFNKANNINGIDGDPNGDGRGLEYQGLQIAAITKIQEAYVRKVADTVNDLDNVLYEISNESGPTSVKWQYHMIQCIKDHEAMKPKQHPVIMSGGWGLPNADLWASPADAVAPGNDRQQKFAFDPPDATGAKVVIIDSDHNESDRKDPAFVWRTFLRGHQPIVMDWWNGPQWAPIRRAMGQARMYAAKVDLAAMTPQRALSSTGFCLAKTGSEYLVYQPASNTPLTVSLAAGAYDFEWFDPGLGAIAATGAFSAKTGDRSFAAPFRGEALLYIKKARRP